MDEQPSPLSALSQQILLRVTEGKKIKAIAHELGTTRDVVDGQMRRIYRHFRVRGIALLVHAAIREGWIQHPAGKYGNRGLLGAAGKMGLASIHHLHAAGCSGVKSRHKAQVQKERQQRGDEPRRLRLLGLARLPENSALPTASTQDA